MALFCNPITGNLFQRVCDLLKGGLAQQIYVANFGEIASITYNVGGEVSAITMKVNPITTPDLYNWFRIVAKKQSAGVTNTAVIGANARYIEQAVTFAVIGIGTLNKAAFETMISGQAVFIVQDSSGVWHIVGEKSGAEMTEGVLGTGIALDDLVGSLMTFVAQENFAMHTVVSGTTIEVLDEDGVTISTVTLTTA
jgi:hypothetical protein